MKVKNITLYFTSYCSSSKIFINTALLLPSSFINKKDNCGHVKKNRIFQTLSSPDLLKDAIKSSDYSNFDGIISKLKLEKPSSFKSLSKIATGCWKVKYAPHINILEKVLFTKFEVSYLFPNSLSPYSLISNVRYTSRLFGTGHLNTAGKYEITQDGKECRIVWDKIWWDLNKDTPSTYKNVEDHILQSAIQYIGKVAFIESVSKFPIDYLDSDICVFKFELFGTTICALKV